MDSSRSNSPRPGSDFYGRRRPRTAHAGDSSQMRESLMQPLSPEEPRKEVVEELCIQVDSNEQRAIPFFDNVSGKVLIRGGQVVNDDGVQVADVLVEDGVITAVGEDVEAPADVKVIDARDKFVLPGGIDSNTHLHSEDEDLPLADGFESGTKAAIIGGTTSVVDLVLPKKGESLVDAYNSWKADAEENACCNFAFRVAVTDWNEQIATEMEELSKVEGINAFKVYMAYKDTLMLDNDAILEVFSKCKELGAMVQIHAENGNIIHENEKRLLARGIKGPEGHLLARPEEVEEEAVQRACAMAKQANVPLYICSPTSKAASEIIAKERAQGQSVIGEPSAAALALDGSHYFNQCWSHAAGFVTSPPLRDDPDTPGALIAAMIADELQIVGSDHRTFATETKAAKGQNNFTKIPHGINGIEDRMAVVWEKGVESAKMTPERFVAVTSSNAARAFNMYPQKGRIEIGSDADIVVWNPNNMRTISSKTHAQAADFNVFEGLKVVGAPEFVLLGGKVVVFEYQSNVSKGSGSLIPTPSFAPFLFDTAQDFERKTAGSAVERESDEVDGPAEETESSSNEMFGVTTPRRSCENPVLNKRLGIYQRPLSAHGVRNQQDSTFSLTGGYNDDDEYNRSRKSGVKVHAPPGGSTGGSFW